jgi:GNAT superfamily N-acetyltransferase
MKVPERFQAGITRCTPDDTDDLAEFQLRMFGPGTRQVDPDRAAWLFDQNPYRTDPATRDLWICRRDGTIVGQQAEIPFDIRIGDRTLRTAWGVDLMVDPKWRVKGVGPALVQTIREANPLILGLNMSEKGFKTTMRMGFSDGGIVPVYIRPLHLDRAAAAGAVSGRIAQVAPYAGPVLRAADRAAVAALAAAGAKLVPVDRFDERLDEVWAAASPHYPVVALRDLTANRWRIDQRPDSDALTRYYLVVRGRPTGYVVVRSGGTADAPTVIVVDYLAPPRWVAPLLVAAGTEARRRDGAIAMSVKTRNEPADRYLRAAVFVRRDKGTDDVIRMVLSCNAEPDVCSLASQPENWLLTSADADLELASAQSPPAEDTAGRPGATPAAP